MLSVTCDNATANDAMIDSLTTIMSDFAGEANRVRCLAHIVNLVVKIILRQFDVSNKKKKNDIPAGGSDLADENGEPDITSTEEDIDELVRVLDKEEKEMDEGDEADDEENPKLVTDIEIIEEAMEEDVREVSKTVKPVRQVLYKVGY
jgi:hypothetical protein